MDTDKMSIASDFSVIPDSMINIDENEAPLLPMSASFFRSEHSSEASAVSSTPLMKVTFYAIEKIGIESQAPLSVIFSVADDFTPKSSDRIALYKVGFSSSKDFLCFKWAPTPSADLDSPYPSTVIFEASILPSDVEEYYQICYLMQNGKIAGVSSPFQLKYIEKSEPNEIVEKAARNVLSIRVNELMKENEELKEELKKKDEELTTSKAATTHLESEMRALELSLESRRKMIKNLKDYIAEKEEAMKKMTHESLEMEKRLEQEQAVASEMQQKLATVVLNMNDLKDSLTATEQGRSITEERQQVLLQDNEDLKETLVIMRDELKNSLKEKAGAEKIAADLSQRLQSACSEYQNMVVINSKLTKKVKKLRKVISLMEATANDDWLLCVGEDSEDKKDDQDTNLSEEGDEDVAEVGHMDPLMNPSEVMAASGCVSSSCSQHLTETVSSVRKMMDDIVTQLSLQTEEMKSLKKEIARRGEPHQESIEAVKEVDKGVQAEAPVEDAEAKEAASPAPSTGATEISSAVTKEVAKGSPYLSEEEKRVIYEKSFLPAHCTAPVFLPTPKTVREVFGSLGSKIHPPRTTPSAPPTPPSMMNEEKASLPAPLLPEPTPTAHQAAILRQFSDNNLLTMDGVQQKTSQPTQEAATAKPPPPHDSDDEDYHSTGDAGEPTPAHRMPSTLKCPMCPLEFLPNSMRLMEEHINNHLDRMCPVCSLAFQRSISQKTFEDHVQSHFDDAECDEHNSALDPSGPWDPRDTRRSFQLLEID